MSLIIGLTGQKGSGKGTFVELVRAALPDVRVVRIASSDILKETLRTWDIAPSRKALQDLAIIMNAHFGEGTLSHAVEARIAQTDAEVIIFDGIRWAADERLVRSFPNNLMVYVHADLEIRFARTKARGEKSDDMTATREQFVAEESAKTELLIPEIGARADVHITNNGTREEYEKEVARICAEIIRPKL